MGLEDSLPKKRENLKILLLTKQNAYSILSIVRAIQKLDIDMREWLSWWSTTLPRSGPRVRVPSRALRIQLLLDPFFHDNKILAKRRFYCRYSGKNCIFYLLDFDKMCYT